MPATFGVVNLHGLAVVAGGYVHESSHEQSIEIATVADETAIVKIAKPRPMVSHKVMIKGKGAANLAAVIVAEADPGELLITEAKQSEKNTDFPEFELHGEKFTNLA